MEKTIIDDVCLEELDEWIFPDVSVPAKSDYYRSPFIFEKENENKNQNENIETAISIPTFDIEAEKKKIMEEKSKIELETLAELENIKNEYKQKIELMTNIVTKLEEPLARLDDELIELMQEIIKKSVKKIILKEIKSDSKLISKMIKELTALIRNQNGLITVYLSEADYKRLKGEKNKKTSFLFIVDPSLMEGDIIVKSNHAEVRAILNNRINQLLGIKNAAFA